jgi:hypothetical protein
MNEETWTSGTDAMVILRLYNINLSDDPDSPFYLFSRPPKQFKVSHSFVKFLASEPTKGEDARTPDFAPGWETDLILPLLEEFLPECLPPSISADTIRAILERLQTANGRLDGIEYFARSRLEPPSIMPPMVRKNKLKKHLVDHFLDDKDFEIQVSLSGKALKILTDNHPAFLHLRVLPTAREIPPTARETPSTAGETETPSSEYTEGLHDGPYEEEALELSFEPEFAPRFNNARSPSPFLPQQRNRLPPIHEPFNEDSDEPVQSFPQRGQSRSPTSGTSPTDEEMMDRDQVQVPPQFGRIRILGTRSTTTAPQVPPRTGVATNANGWRYLNNEATLHFA